MQLRVTSTRARSTRPGRDSGPRPLVRRGLAGLPVAVRTDGEYTAFAAVAAGQFETVKDHLRALRDVSDNVNNRSGKVVHEVTPDG